MPPDSIVGGGPVSPPNSVELERLVRRYEAILRTGPTFVQIQDATLSSLWTTTSLRSELGYNGSASTAPGGDTFVHPDDRTTALEVLQRLLQGAPSGFARLRARHADGHWRWLAVHSINLLEDPDVAGIVTHAWDITGDVAHEEEIAASRKVLVALIDTLDEGVVVVSDGTIAYANAKLAQLFPSVAAADSLIGLDAQAFQEALAGVMRDPASFLADSQRFVSESRTVRGWVLETADGRSLEQHFVPASVVGHVASGMWIYRDVSAQRQLEGRRERLLALERDARRNAERQNERLRQLDEMKTSFVATVSHELRTPLTAVRSYVDLLLDPEGDPLSAEQRELASAAQRGALRLERLVDDLLVLAQLQSRSLRVDRAATDVPATVTETVEEVRKISAVPIVVDMTAGPSIGTDRIRLTQIVSNLLGNAVKFARGEVRCRARPATDEWLIEVLDDGPGIPPEDLERIFEPFFRGRQPNGSSRKGAGLGLAISAQLAELLGGTLEIANRPTGGAAARLTLPFDAERHGGNDG